MSKNPLLNRAHQKAWYARIRHDPERWRVFLEKRRTYKQAKRDGVLKHRPAHSTTKDLEPDPGIEVEDILRHVQELFDERLAIMEMDGRVPRDEAVRCVSNLVTQTFGPNAAFRVMDYPEESPSGVPF